jgi:2-amino-4-hydroxy-6-hydroxymethyldihydropteridine diphosphokinase
MEFVYLGLGSNVGDCIGNLKRAGDELCSFMGIVTCSSILRTKPLYVTNQPDFYNQIIKVETKISPLNLLSLIKGIEINLGRVPTFRYGPRVIDIDILYYNQLVIHSQNLEIPHPKNNEREFILTLMAELAPEFICPKTNRVMGAQLDFLRQRLAA